MSDDAREPQATTTDRAALLYLDLLKRCVTNLIYEDPAVRYPDDDSSDETFVPFDRERRETARDWPSQAHTMIGTRRLDHLQGLITEVVATGVPGDLIETGVWRGGSVIFMRGVLEALDVRDRVVWVADSFEGFPTTPEQGATERSYTSLPSDLMQNPQVQAVVTGNSLEDVRKNFERYGLLDEQVRFLPGWFRHTLPSAPIERLALLRLDGDLYDSTRDALEALYPKVSPGGYVVTDDYGDYEECRSAVHDYLDGIGETVDLRPIDENAVYWQRRR
jgi:Macrocin-O-methyltransferase (TylF)